MCPGSEIYKKYFSASSDHNYQDISQRLVITKDWDEYEGMVRKVTSTGLYADIGTEPYVEEEEYKDWYRSSETLSGDNPYVVHLTNKKWPLKKVCCKNH